MLHHNEHATLTLPTQAPFVKQLEGEVGAGYALLAPKAVLQDVSQG